MAFDVVLDDSERLADLQNGGGVGDVLRGGAPMRPFAEPVLAQLDELLHHRQHRIADALGRFLEFGHVDLAGVAMAHDLGGGVFRDDAEPALRARQRRLEVEIFLHAIFVRPHLAHRRRGENVAKHRGIEDGRGHSGLLDAQVARRCANLCGMAADKPGHDSVRENRMNVRTEPQRGFKLEPVHPKPEEAHTMPYAPAVHIVGACDLMFLSGATPSPLYHKHPHVDAEHVHPHSIEEQTTRAMEAIKSILDHTGASWRDVVKVTKYLTDFREADAMHETMAKYFGDWRPASTTVCINQLSSPGARIELDMIVALPKKASVTLPPHLARIVAAEIRASPTPRWRGAARRWKCCSPNTTAII